MWTLVLLLASASVAAARPVLGAGCNGVFVNVKPEANSDVRTQEFACNRATVCRAEYFSYEMNPHGDDKIQIQVTDATNCGNNESAANVWYQERFDIDLETYLTENGGQDKQNVLLPQRESSNYCVSFKCLNLPQYPCRSYNVQAKMTCGDVTTQTGDGTPAAVTMATDNSTPAAVTTTTGNGTTASSPGTIIEYPFAMIIAITGVLCTLL